VESTSGLLRSRRAPIVGVLATMVIVLGGCGDSKPEALHVVKVDMVSARTADVTVESPALGETTTVRLLLPTVFDERPGRHWPVLYLLHGCCDTYKSWTRSTDVEALSADLGALVAMPHGGEVGFYSNWIDGPQWETFHTEELPAILAQEFNAGGRAAIAGVSMGGLGALGYAARHPGQFSAAASYSGIVHTQLSMSSESNYTGLVDSYGYDMAHLWGSHDSTAWSAHNPYALAEELRGTDLFISVGNGKPGPLDAPGSDEDSIETSLHEENLALRGRLHSLGISAEFDFYGPGTHTWPYWQRELHRSWTWLMAALNASQLRDRPG
jgi:diacylglycerol O-acyltransferase / trehalose O-mycolyltransferase